MPLNIVVFIYCNCCFWRVYMQSQTTVHGMDGFVMQIYISQALLLYLWSSVQKYIILHLNCINLIWANRFSGTSGKKKINVTISISWISVNSNSSSSIKQRCMQLTKESRGTLGFFPSVNMVKFKWHILFTLIVPQLLWVLLLRDIAWEIGPMRNLAGVIGCRKIKSDHTADGAGRSHKEIVTMLEKV